MTPSDYHVALGIALLVIGVALVFGGVISWRRASQPDPSERDDDSELRAFIDSLPETDQESEGERPPRVIRNEDSSK